MNMKKALKNVNLYYIAVPLLAALWAALAGFAFYPNAVENWEDCEQEFEQSKDLIAQLIKLQPDRLDYQFEKGDGNQEFDFNKVINEFTRAFSIPDSACTSNVRSPAKRAGRVTKSATLAIKSIDIEKLSQFISAMLLRWPDLQCEVLGLQLKKNTKNTWQADLSLTYYY